MTYLNQIETLAADSPSIDAFGRWRSSNPYGLFSSKTIADALPLLWDDAAVSGAGTSSTLNTNRASVTLGVGATTAGVRTRQTRRRFNYQPGKSQLALITFVLGAAAAGITREVGLFDDRNGLFLRQNSTSAYFVRRTYATGAAVDTAVAQADWNVDQLDGTGPSGITLDLSKSQILFTDFEWLGVGRVRMGFVVDGAFIVAHEFLNANSLDVVYMSTPNLPVRYQITNSGAGAAATLEVICCSVMSEGGQEEIGTNVGVDNGTTQVSANTGGTTYPLVGVKLRSGYEGVTVIPKAISVLATTNDDILWSLQFNPTITGTFTYADVTNSAIQRALGDTATVSTPGFVLQSGYAEASQAIGVTASDIALGSKIDGTLDAIVLCATPLGTGAVNADIFGALTLRAIV